MPLPEHKYFTLQQAAKKAGCGVDDLIHFASIGILELCIKIPSMGFYTSSKKSGDTSEPISINSFSSINDPSIRADDGSTFPEVVYDDMSFSVAPKDLIVEYDGEMIHRRRYFYSSPYLNVTEYYDREKKIKGVEKWNGLLAVPSVWIAEEESFLADDLVYSLNVDVLSPPRTAEFKATENYTIGDFYLNDWYEVYGYHLLITNYEFGLLMNGGKRINENSLAQDKTGAKKDSSIHNGSISEVQVINKRMERFAVDREKLLKSAIFLLSKYPLECRGERKDISPEKWRDCILNHLEEVPPLKIANEDVILKHLRSAVNGKG